MPALKPQPEPIGDGTVKVRLLAGAKGVPAPTPQARFYRVMENGLTRDVKWFSPVDLWRNRQLIGEWTDKHGNVQRVANVKSLAPVLGRAELLVAAEDPKRALSTMRHEAFHQYLHYATGNANHAMWFNEGHACFFENIKYNAAKNAVKVVEKGNRATWVAKDPVRYANCLSGMLRMTRDEFYSGDQNLHYCTAWALVYFLEKGVYTSREFAEYRQVIPKYLELTAAGMPADQATAVAWSAVAHRNVAADFMMFWTEKRKAAVNARW